MKDNGYSISASVLNSIHVGAARIKHKNALLKRLKLINKIKALKAQIKSNNAGE